MKAWISSVVMLLKWSSDVNHQNFLHKTALQEAISHGHAPVRKNPPHMTIMESFMINL
jgi:hypothetical protein